MARKKTNTEEDIVEPEGVLENFSSTTDIDTALEVAHTEPREEDGVRGEGDDADALTDIPVIAPEDRLPTIPQLCVAVAILAAVLGYPTIHQMFRAAATTPPAAAVQETAPPEPVKEEVVPEKIDPFAEVSLEARAAYVWDVSAQRVIYAKSPHTQLPLASLTKLMTALVAHETYGEHAQVPITLAAIGQEGENGFQDGDSWFVEDLLAYTLMTSSNDGAYALAAAAGALLAPESDDSTKAFLDKMNAKAKEVGLTQTYFTNPTGLDSSETESGSYGSARDMAFLMEYIVRNVPELLQQTSNTVSEFSDTKGTIYTATNTNQTIDRIPNALGSKTGYTVLAGGNLVVAFDAGLNHPIVISVLGSTREGRFTDVETLTQKTLELFAETP